MRHNPFSTQTLTSINPMAINPLKDMKTDAELRTAAQTIHIPDPNALRQLQHELEEAEAALRSLYREPEPPPQGGASISALEGSVSIHVLDIISKGAHTVAHLLANPNPITPESMARAVDEVETTYRRPIENLHRERHGLEPQLVEVLRHPWTAPSFWGWYTVTPEMMASAKNLCDAMVVAESGASSLSRHGVLFRFRLSLVVGLNVGFMLVWEDGKCHVSSSSVLLPASRSQAR